MSGNGLSVFLLDDDLPASAMQRITRDARIFTMEEELSFAGHPVLVPRR